jgi:hypothetical protein
MSPENTAQAKSDNPPLIEKSTVLAMVKDQMHLLQKQAKELLNKSLVIEDDLLVEDYEHSMQDVITHASLSSSLTELKALHDKINKL